MPNSKSKAKTNWLTRLWSTIGGISRSKGRLAANRLRLEQLESRRVFAAILLDIPGINGDATGAGATATDIELQDFQWGFSRTSPTATPIVQAVKFKKIQDSSSNDLYGQSNFAPFGNKAVLRLVDQTVPGGKNLLRFDLDNTRVTSYSTGSNRHEDGSLVFSKVDFTESLGTTNRTASFNLLSGAASGSAIAGSTSIDVGGNLNLETVMTIGTQKFVINSFEWSAETKGNVLNTPGSLGTATSKNFSITRAVDQGTAGFLRSAAAGTNLGTVTISDRRPVTTGGVTVNKSVMEWKLYDAVILDFGLDVKTEGVPTNGLGLAYSKIELIVNQFNSKGLAGPALTTTWDQANNTITSATTFGIADPAIADSAPVASYLDFGALGRVSYDEINWAVSKPTTITVDDIGVKITQDKTVASSLAITLPAGSSTPALLGNLVAKNVLPTVAANEKNTANNLSSLNTFIYTNSAITDFSISSKGIDDPLVKFNLDFQNAAETFNARSIPLITRGNFNEVTQTSTGVLSFGGQSINTEFELVIKEAGVTSEIPVLSADWSVGRGVSRGGGGASTEATAPRLDTFDFTIPRGIHSPGLFNAASRGTKIDEAFLYRYKTVNGDKIQTYRWQLTDAFLTTFAAHMLPGNSEEEIDTLSLLPSKIILATDKLDELGNDIGNLSAGWDFTTNLPASLPGLDDDAGDFGSVSDKSNVLQAKFDGETLVAAIDSYRWGALLPVDETTAQGVRPLGNPDANDLVLNFASLPSPRFLKEALNSKPNAKVTLDSKNNLNLQETYTLELNEAIIDGYSYSDKVGSTNAENSASVFSGSNAFLTYTPLDPQGNAGSPLKVDWNIDDATATQTGGFGGFQFSDNSAPETTLEFFDGTTRSQVAASDYSFGTSNATLQPVGKLGASVPPATTGVAEPGKFGVTTQLDRTTPALLGAIALRTKLPEIRIVERRLMTVAGSPQFLPFREWLLKDVYIEEMVNTASDVKRFGSLDLVLNPGSATSKLITYNESGTPASVSRAIDFVTPPTTTGIAPINMISTDVQRVVDLPSRFTDESQASSTLGYAVTVLSGANLLDFVTVTSLNRLVVDPKAGQGGRGQLRIDVTDSFGLVGSTVVDISVDVDGIGTAPAGTNQTVTTAEDTAYTFTATDFGFTDPNDFPANTFTSVTVASFPIKGSLRLNNVTVSVNQTIPIASIIAGQLKFTPIANENGNAHSSFLFQVRDDGVTSNVDLSPNTFTLNVSPVNDAPVITAGNTIVNLPSIGEDSIDPNGALLTSVGALISDVDAGALKGLAVFSAETTNGNWQFAVDGVTWQNFGTVSATAARLLAVDATTRIRFAPNANFNSPLPNSLGFYAWDQTTGSVGAIADVQQRGVTTAFGLLAGQVQQLVTPVNDAPILNTTDVLLPSINEDTANPAGVLVSTLLTGMSDIDVGSTKGMAVRGVQNSNGNWQFSLNSGSTWTPFSSVNPTNARLLPSNPTTRVRFVPDANFTGNRGFSFHAWDRSTGIDGSTVDLTLSGATGGTSAVSTDFAFAIINIAAINDAPVIASPAALTVTVNTPVVFSTANGNAISVSDVDVNTSSLPVEVQFVASKGRFALSTLTGITLTLGTNDSLGFTIRGSVASINAALTGAIYTPTTDTFGAGSLRLVVNDLGNLGVGTALTRAKSTAITIDPLPVATDLGTLDLSTPSAFSVGQIPSGQSTSLYYSVTLAVATDVRMVLSGLTVNADLFVATSAGLPVIDSREAGTTIEDLVFTAFSPGSYIIRVKALAVPTVSSSFNLSVSRSLTTDDLLVNAGSLGTLSAATLPTVRSVNSAGGSSDIQDYYKFKTTAASGFRLNLSGLTDDLDVQLLNSKGVLVRSSVLGQTSIETIVTSNLVAGDYFIRVFALPGRNVSSYDLSVSLNINADDSISRPTTLGTLNPTNLPVVRRNGLVGGAADIQDYYSFSLAAPRDVRINLTGLSKDVDLQLLDTFGVGIAGGINSSNNNENVLATQLPAGTYYVRVYAVAAIDTSLYDLVIAIDPTSDDLLSNAATLRLSSSVATVNKTGGVNLVTDTNDYYQFTLAAVANVRINLSGLSSDADLQLEDAFGRLIGNSTRSGNAFEDLSMTSLAAGTYYVRVNAFAGATNYLLIVSTATTTDDLISNATVLPTLTSDTMPTARTTSTAGGLDIQDYYQFQLNTAGNLRLALSNLTTDLDVEILDQFGQVIVFGTQSGNTIERVTTPVLTVGLYYIRVFQLFVGGPASNYNLEISTDFNGDDLIQGGLNLGTLAASPLTSNGTVGGAADIQDYFSFTTTTTRNVRFLLTGLTADVDFQILDSFGRVIAAGTSGSLTTEDLTVNALAPGSYFIRVFAFAAGVSNYSLSVS